MLWTAVYPFIMNPWCAWLLVCLIYKFQSFRNSIKVHTDLDYSIADGLSNPDIYTLFRIPPGHHANSACLHARCACFHVRFNNNDQFTHREKLNRHEISSTLGGLTSIWRVIALFKPSHYFSSVRFRVNQGYIHASQAWRWPLQLQWSKKMLQRLWNFCCFISLLHETQTCTVYFFLSQRMCNN